MKNAIVLLIILISTNIFSQEIKTIYYDSEWHVLPSKKNASYFRKIENNPNKEKHYIIKDYYITGEIQMEAEMTSYEPEIMDGDVSYFFKNGHKSTERKYINGKENGYYKEWYENGEIEKEGLIQNNEQTGEWKYYYANEKLRMVGTLTNGKKNGIWKIYNLDGQFYLQQSYNNDVLTGLDLIDKSKGLYEYFTEIDSTGKYSIIPFIDYETNEEFKLSEPLIKNNITFLQTCTDPNNFSINYAYTLIWLSNCPYIGKFAINTTKFMVDYVTEIEKSYKYSSEMTKMYILGLGSYLLDNKGKINSLSKFHESGAVCMLNYYKTLQNIDAKEKSKKLESLLDLQKDGKLLNFIEKY